MMTNWSSIVMIKVLEMMVNFYSYQHFRSDVNIKMKIEQPFSFIIPWQGPLQRLQCFPAPRRCNQNNRFQTFFFEEEE